MAPINVLEFSATLITLEVPNIFVQEYLISNYKKDLCAFLPVNANGEPSIKFIVAAPVKALVAPLCILQRPKLGRRNKIAGKAQQVKLNNNYSFETFIEGPTNQFVKSAAIGVANRPALSYNPLFIHGGVGLGKTHILHSIGHHIMQNHKNCASNASQRKHLLMT